MNWWPYLFLTGLGIFALGAWRWRQHRRAQLDHKWNEFLTAIRCPTCTCEPSNVEEEDQP